MGCVVNGPGEAREADLGIAAGNKRGHLFVKGRNVAVVPEAEMVDALVEWAEFIVAHGVDAAIARADTTLAEREAERDRRRNLGERGDDANDAGQKIELIQQAGGELAGRYPALPYGSTECPHLTGRGLPPLVPGRRGQGRPGRQRAGAGHDGHPPVRLLDLGADAGRGGRPHQGRRRRQLLLPAVHPRELPPPRGRARRGLRPRGGRRHPRRRQGAGGAGRGAAHQRDHHQHLLLEVGAELPRPAAAGEPVGQRGALGAAAPPVPAHHRVPLAGGPHRPRHPRGRRRLRRARSSTRSTPTSW